MAESKSTHGPKKVTVPREGVTVISARKPKNEPERLNALRGFELLDTEPEDAFDAMTRVAATLCRVPIALVSLVDEKRQWFKSQCGLAGVTSTGVTSRFVGTRFCRTGFLRCPTLGRIRVLRITRW